MSLLDVLAFDGDRGVRADGFVERLAIAAVRDSQIVKTLCHRFAAAFPPGLLAKPRELNRLMAQIGISHLPIAVDSLEDEAASAEILSGGRAAPLFASRNPADRLAIRAAQDALIKIGAHWPDLDAETRATLVMTPHGADGQAGPATRRALSAAFELSQAPDAPTLRVRLGRGRPRFDRQAAEIIESLLRDPRAPAQIAGPDAARTLHRAQLSDCALIGFSDLRRLDRLLLTQFLAGRRVRTRFFHDLDDALIETPIADIDALVARLDGLFEPTPTPSEREALGAFLSRSLVGDGLDGAADGSVRMMREMVELALAFHQAEHGQRPLEIVVVNSGCRRRVDRAAAPEGDAPVRWRRGPRAPFLPETIGETPDGWLARLAALYPKAAAGVGMIFYTSGHRLTMAHALREFLPSPRAQTPLARFRDGGDGVAIGYHGPAPGLWFGGFGDIVSAIELFLGAKSRSGAVTGDDVLDAWRRAGPEWSALRQEPQDHTAFRFDQLRFVVAKTGSMLRFATAASDGETEHGPLLDRFRVERAPLSFDAAAARVLEKTAERIKPDASEAARRRLSAKGRRLAIAGMAKRLEADEKALRAEAEEADRLWRREVRPLLTDEAARMPGRRVEDVSSVDAAELNAAARYLASVDALCARGRALDRRAFVIDAVTRADGELPSEAALSHAYDDNARGATTAWSGRLGLGPAELGTIERRRLIAENVLGWRSTIVPSFRRRTTPDIVAVLNAVEADLDGKLLEAQAIWEWRANLELIAAAAAKPLDEVDAADVERTAALVRFMLEAPFEGVASAEAIARRLADETIGEADAPT